MLIEDSIFDHSVQPTDRDTEWLLEKSRRKEPKWGVDDVCMNGLDPFKEHVRLKTQLDLPMNPAYFEFLESDKRQLQSLNSYCRAN
jgi:hypothetical protein